MKAPIIFCLTAMLAFLTACTPQSLKPNGETRSVTDMAGRAVTIPQNVNRVACIGAGALRLYTYVAEVQRICAVEDCEKKFLISVRPYQMIHQETFRNLPSLGPGGPTGHAEPEALIKANPDLIFTTYTQNPQALDKLQNDTGIPVVALSYGQREALDPAIRKSLELIGEIMGTQKRAEQLTDYMTGLLDDLQRRTATIPTQHKPTVYLACHSNYGTHGFTSSTANFPLFQAVKARNVLDEQGFKGYQKQVDLETILKLNPDKIVFDAAGLPIFRQEYHNRKELFCTMKAFQQGQLFVQLPYNAYHTNLEIAYANAFFIAKVLYPDQCQDIDPARKADEIARAFLGQNIYGEMQRQLKGGFRKLILTENNP